MVPTTRSWTSVARWRRRRASGSPSRARREPRTRPYHRLRPCPCGRRPSPGRRSSAGSPAASGEWLARPDRAARRRRPGHALAASASRRSRSSAIASSRSSGRRSHGSLVVCNSCAPAGRDRDRAALHERLPRPDRRPSPGNAPRTDPCRHEEPPQRSAVVRTDDRTGHRTNPAPPTCCGSTSRPSTRPLRRVRSRPPGPSPRSMWRCRSPGSTSGRVSRHRSVPRPRPGCRPSTRRSPGCARCSVASAVAGILIADEYHRQDWLTAASGPRASRSLRSSTG